MDNPFSIDVKNDSDAQLLIVTGELIINHIDNLKDQLIKAIDLSKNLNIKVTNPSSMDITFVQVLLALQASYKNNGLNIDIEGTLNEEVFALIANAGFNNLFKL